MAAFDKALEDGLGWDDAVRNGKRWGGRGKGGRGIARQLACQSSRTRDVSIPSFSLAYEGNELLSGAALRLSPGRRYVLLGRNGVGKTTLLRRIRAARIPGFPLHLRVAYLSQEQEPRTAGDGDRSAGADPGDEAAPDGKTVLEALADDSMELIDAQAQREAQQLEDLLGECAEGEVEAIAERLAEIEQQREEWVGSNFGKLCEETLRAVGFKKRHREGLAATLSGGWRMRLRLAGALISNSDLLLLDEPTNHLDLDGVAWLQRFLTGALAEDSSVKPPPIVVFVSHDEAFVRAVATDVVVMEDKTLKYHAGDFGDYVAHREERSRDHTRRLDAKVRSERKAHESAQFLRNRARKSRKGGEKLARQARQQVAKTERLGLYRDDGKRYKTNSLKTFDEKAARLPQQTVAKRALREDRFTFPTPDAAALRNASAALVEIDALTYAYDGAQQPLFSGITAAVSYGRKVALVGDNGAGKTTLLRLLVGELSPTAGGLRVHPRCRVAFMKQHHEELLLQDQDATATQILVGVAGISELNARTVLGKFGLTGDAALRPVRDLSGGQRVRASMALLTHDRPHLLVMDEPTNHLDLTALRALGDGLRAFEGAVLLVSHNRAFVSAFCQDLWVLDGGGLSARSGGGENDDSAPFDELFQDYCDGLGASDGNTKAQRVNRQAKRSGLRGVKRGTGHGIARRAALL